MLIESAAASEAEEKTDNKMGSTAAVVVGDTISVEIRFAGDQDRLTLSQSVLLQALVSWQTAAVPQPLHMQRTAGTCQS